jgi:hypothetical protein
MANDARIIAGIDLDGSGVPFSVWMPWNYRATLARLAAAA